MGETTVATVCIYSRYGIGGETLLHRKLVGAEATVENVEKAFEELSVGVKEECFQAAPLQEREKLFLKRCAKTKPS
jgi:hypothetical protein